MTIRTIGIDLAKNVFEICGLDENGEIQLRRRVRRETLLRAVGEIPACVIGIEACTGAFFWQRQLEVFGHEVRIIAPQHVKPFRRRQKNDRVQLDHALPSASLTCSMTCDRAAGRWR